MKISKVQLQRIIKEAITAALDEQAVAPPLEVYPDPKDPEYDPRLGPVTILPGASEEERLGGVGFLTGDPTHYKTKSLGRPSNKRRKREDTPFAAIGAGPGEGGEDIAHTASPEYLEWEAGKVTKENKMKISKSQLDQIIQEELAGVLDEYDADNPVHPSHLEAGSGLDRQELGFPSPGSLEYKAAKAGNIVGKIAKKPSELVASAGELAGTFKKALGARLAKPATPTPVGTPPQTRLNPETGTPEVVMTDEAGNDYWGKDPR